MSRGMEGDGLMEFGEDQPGRGRQESRTARGGTPTITRPQRAPAPRQRNTPESGSDGAARGQQPRRRVPPQYSSGGTTATPQDPPRRAAQGRPRKTPQDLARPKPLAPAPGAAQPPKAPQGPPSPARPMAERLPAGSRSARAQAAQRMPFLLLVCGLLGGALVSALVISTTLAQGSFQITQLQQQNGQLARQRQQLENQVASAGSAQVIEQEAYRLGMRPVGLIRFLDIKDGQVKTDAGSGTVNTINVPGFTP